MSAIGADDPHALRRDLLAGGQEFGAERRDDALGHGAGHDVAVHGAVFGGEVEQPRDARPRVALDVGRAAAVNATANAVATASSRSEKC